MIKLLSWHHKIIWNQDSFLFKIHTFYNLATLIKQYNLKLWKQDFYTDCIHTAHSLTHPYFYVYPQGQMSKLFLELNVGISPFTWPFICMLMYKYHIFTPTSDVHFLTSSLKYIYIYLVGPGINCRTQGVQSLLWHARYWIVACKI